MNNSQISSASFKKIVSYKFKFHIFKNRIFQETQKTEFQLNRSTDFARKYCIFRVFNARIGWVHEIWSFEFLKKVFPLLWTDDILKSQNDVYLWDTTFDSASFCLMWGYGRIQNCVTCFILSYVGLWADTERCQLLK